MEEKKINSSDVIDLRVIFKKIWDGRKLYLKILPVVFFLSCAYILGIPRYYTSETSLAPELDGSASGSIGSIASAFGLDLGNMQTTDAIYPNLYPDLMEDNGFVAGLFNIKVVSQDGEINTSYHDYIKKHQKVSIWSYPMIWVGRLFKSTKKTANTSSDFNPYILSKEEVDVLESIRGNIMFNFNEKTGVVSIKTKAQDPLICKTLADSVRSHLQAFITEYRTNKARVDYEYYQQLAIKAKADYEKVRRQYASMADASTHISLKSVELKLQDLENEMQLKFNAYTTINTQLEAAKAKVQERTPAFTTLKGASMPIKPAGPKRMFFVLFMLVLTTLVISTYILREDIMKIISINR